MEGSKKERLHEEKDMDDRMVESSVDVLSRHYACATAHHPNAART